MKTGLFKAQAATGLLLAATLWGGPGLAHADTLTTQSFSIQIQSNCAEGDVVCDDVTYRGKSRRTGQSLVLKGKTMHSLCADGVTPCRFLGYEFRNGPFRYVVYENGGLLVTRGKKVLVEETGNWQP
ncbi:MAG: hypothetical protein Q7T70_11015 [Polaromonas sp.]|nr:hypothetical protein [Polaromonas sp.]